MRTSQHIAFVLLLPALLLPLGACSDSDAPTRPPESSDLEDDLPVHFSHEAGFYSKPFQLTLSSDLEGATIYYTVDGSEPDPARVIPDSVHEVQRPEQRERTYIYSGPLDMAELARRPAEITLIRTTVGWGGWDEWQVPALPSYRGTVVRARAIGEEGDSGVRTRSYFIDPKGRRRYSLPVLSVAVANTGLFGAESGIYVPGSSGENYERRGDEWERPVHLEYFEVDGSRVVAQGAGVRIHGGYTRRFPRKSLRLYARSEYGTSRFSHRFFGSKKQARFKRLIVRNGGNDHNLALFRDAALQTLVRHLKFETQHFQPVIVFINGEYWGIHALRDRYDDHHLSLRHGIERDEMALLENDAELITGDPEEAAKWREFNERAARGALRSRAEVEAEIDLDGYLDYVIAQMYAANTDWPHNNVMLWRYTGPARGAAGDVALDGRWRWLMYDVDISFGLTSTKETDMVSHLMVGAGEHRSRHLFRGLMGIPEIRHEFLQRAAVHLETTMHPTRVLGVIDSIAALLEPEMQEHTRRWRIPASPAAWKTNVGVLREFAKGRPDHFREHLRAGFGEVTGMAELTIGGLARGEGLTLHTVSLEPGEPGVYLKGGRWTGRLFTGIPVVLRAGGIDLREAALSGAFTEVRREAGELSFIMKGAVRVELGGG